MIRGRAWVVGLGALLLAACSSGHRVSYVQGAGAAALPDSLKAKAHFTVIAPDGSREKMSAVLFAVPRQRYRLELSATMGVGAASLLWQPSGWTLLFPTEESYVQGQGTEVRVPGTLLSGIDVHEMAAIFWGDLLPAGGMAAERHVSGADSVLEWEPRIGLRYKAVLRGDGWVKKVERWEEGRVPMAVSYGEPQFLQGYRYVPVSATFSRDGKAFLEVQLKAVDTQAQWGGGVWKLPVPSQYRLWGMGD